MGALRRIVNSIRGVFSENKKDLAHPPGIITPDMSPFALYTRIGCPVALFYLDQLPYAPKGEDPDRQLTPKENKKRSKALRKLLKTWSEKEWPIMTGKILKGASQSNTVTLGQLFTPLRMVFANLRSMQNVLVAAAKAGKDNSSPYAYVQTAYTKSCPLPPVFDGQALPLRLEGELSPIAANLFAPSRTWQAKQDWARLASLNESEIENIPANPKLCKNFAFLHECGHILQRRPADEEKRKSPENSWLIEYDADSFAFEQLSKQGASREEIKALKMLRSLGGFLGATDSYQLALAHDEPDREKAIASRVAGVESIHKLRKLVTMRLLQGLSDDDVKDAYAMVFSALFPSKGMMPEISLPALREVTEKLAGTLPANDPLRRTAELTLEAAHYFCPTLTEKPLVAKIKIKRPNPPATKPGDEARP